MLIVVILLAVLIALTLFMTRPRRKRGEPFDWSHRRPWWKPRSLFPDDR